MRKVGVLVCVCCMLSFLLVSPALAGTLFTLESADNFQTAITAGDLEPQTTTAGDPSLVDHYPAGTFKVATVTAYTQTGPYDFGDPDGGLVMDWGTSEDAEVYAQWLYTFDPDMTGKIVKATVFAPTGITSISLSIIDNLGNSRSWDWNVGGAGPIPNNALTPISISVQGMGLGGPGDATPLANSYFDGGTGLVDPTNITQFGFDENGNWVAFTQVSPTGGTGPWNYWGRIQTVVPEPSTFVLLCMGAIGLLLNVRRGRK